MREMQEQIKELKQMIQSTNAMQLASYASVTKLAKPDPAVLIKPKNANQPNIDTRREVKAQFYPT